MSFGLINKVVKFEELLQTTEKLAQRLRGKSGLALALTKNILNKTFELGTENLLELEASSQDICFTSAYYEQAIASVLAKRK